MGTAAVLLRVLVNVLLLRTVGWAVGTALVLKATVLQGCSSSEVLRALLFFLDPLVATM